jgi:hypothetical protein
MQYLIFFTNSFRKLSSGQFTTTHINYNWTHFFFKLINTKLNF